METVSDALAQLRESLPGYRQREGQSRMAEQVSLTFESPTQAFAMVEAGTGVGKTFGYLVPGILAARRTGKRLVVSTATVTLQNQLADKDLPMLARIFEGLRYALIKGRNRYVCLLKLDHQAVSVQQELFPSESVGIHSQHAAPLFKRFRDGDWDGCRDSLAEPMPDREWKDVAADAAFCMGDHCRYYCDCPLVCAGKRVENADVIIANHDLLLFSYQAGSRLLPRPEDSLVVFDEAHHLPSKAIQARQLSTIMQKAAEIVKSAPEIISECAADRDLVSLVEGYADVVFADLRDLQRQIKRLFVNPKGLSKANDALVFPSSGIGETLSVSPSATISHLYEINDAAISARNAAEGRSVDSRHRHASLMTVVQAERNFSKIAALAHEINKVVCAIEAFTTDDGHNDMARWIETIATAGKKDYQTVAAPIDAAHVLGGLWRRIYAAVLTSATLSPYGELSRTRRDFGLPRETAELIIESPFDYGRARMVVPPLRADPRNHDSHTQEISKMLPKILRSTTKGSLVLFASARQMNEVAARMPAPVRAKVLVQGEKSPVEILRLHRERCAQGQRSVIFGLASFGEGVDLPGDLCELVVIAKLPFAPPGDPYGVARENWIRNRGGNPFLEMQVPKTAIVLKQQVGRLIRGENDHGRVVVLDPRLTHTAYGKLMTKGLPISVDATGTAAA